MQLFPASSGGSWGIPRPDKISNSSNVFRVYLRASYQLDMPRKSSKEVSWSNASKPSQLAPFYVKEQCLSSPFLRVSPVSLWRKLKSWLLPKAMTIGAGWNVDCVVSRKFLAQPQWSGTMPTHTPPIHLSISCVISPSLMTPRFS